MIHKEKTKKIREAARQALYATPHDQECEVPIMIATLRELVKQFQRYGAVDVVVIHNLIEELECTKDLSFSRNSHYIHKSKK